MRNKLFIRFSNASPDQVSWIRVGAQGETGPESSGSLEQAARDATGCHVIVLVPGEDVLLTSAVVPSKNRQRIISAIPYLLEEQLADDIGAMHCAIGLRKPDGRVSAAIVERARIDQWLQRLKDAGIEPEVLIPDILALPEETDGWTLLEESDMTLLRTGPQAGYVVDVDNTVTFLGLLLEDSHDNKPARIRIYDCKSNKEDAPSLDLSGLGVDISAEFYEQSALDLLSQNFDEKTGINLLQGEYSRREQMEKFLRPWRPAAALLALLLFINIGVTVEKYFSLSKESETLKQSIEQTYLKAFPDARRVVNPRVQMEQRLEGLRGGSSSDSGDFLDLLAKTGNSLGNTAGLELRRVSYSGGKLDIALTINDLQGLDQLKQQLAKSTGLNVDIQSATARGKGVEANIQLKGAGP